MEHTFVTTFDKALIRKALNHFFLNRLGWSTFAAIAFVIVGYSFLMLIGHWSALWTILSAVLSIPVIILILIYFFRLQQSQTFLSRMRNPIVRYTVSDEGVKTESDLGSSSLKWAVFDELLKFPDVWLLVYGKSGYLTLRESEMSDEAKRVIETNISGVKKDG